MTTEAVKKTGTLEVTTPSEREVAMTRIFDAPRDWFSGRGRSLTW